MRTAYEAHDWLLKLYNHILKYGEHGGQALEYLRSRGINDEMIEKFQLGYSVKETHMVVSFLESKNFSTHGLLNRKIINLSKRGNYFDPFFDRLVFPIFDFNDRVVGFGGRAMDDDNKIKYLNSPETRIYKKQDNLYGLTQAKEGIKEEGYLVLFEGYFDVIKAHQYGLTNSVASLGTALTPEQAMLIKSVTKNVVVVLDNDEAGINASFRSASVLEAVGVNCVIGKINNEEDVGDPDEYFEKYKDKDRFVNEVVKTAVDRKTFFVNEKINTIDLNNGNQRFTLLNEMLSELSTDINERIEWVRLINERLGIPTNIINSVIVSRGA